MASQDASQPQRVVLGGVSGRMGRLVVAALAEQPEFTLVGGLSSTDDPQRLLRSDVADVYLDLTVASAARELAPMAARAGLSPVVGTSGLGEQDLANLAAACGAGAVGGIVVPNFSIGAVNQMLAAESAARHLTCDGIAEVHHAGKRDSPSGTARATARIIARTTGGAEPLITAERRDDVLASQSVTFSGDHERLVFSHTVEDRQAYLPGLLLALRRVRSLPGLVIGLEHLLD